MGVPTPGARLRLRHDVLAAAGRLERGRRVGPPSRHPAAEVAGCEAARLVSGGDRLQPCAGRSTRPKSGPSPVDRARPGSKHHVLVDGQGVPLAVSLTGGNRNDVTQLLPLLAKVPSVAGLVGRPRRRPDMVLGDRGYDHDKYRRLVWALGIKPVIARRGTP
ncbi:transposase, partial [Streptomyces sp. SID7958]|nr:transposase [Streptomyces sp. SID7958]